MTVNSQYVASRQFQLNENILRESTYQSASSSTSAMNISTEQVGLAASTDSFEFGYEIDMQASAGSSSQSKEKELIDSIKIVASTYHMDYEHLSSAQMINELQLKCFESLRKSCENSAWTKIDSISFHVGQIKNQKGENLLIYFLLHTRDEDAILHLIEKKIGIFGTDNEGNTPLHIVSRLGDVLYFKRLISCSNQGARNSHGLTAMYTAIEADRVNLLKLNVEMTPCQVEGREGNFIRLSPLAFAAGRGAFNCVEFLSEKIKLKDDLNEIGTILHVAIYFKVDLKKLFEGRSEAFKNGLKEIVNKPNRDGKTPFHFAAELSQEKSLEVLNDYGADIESVDHEGLTPAHAAAMNCDDAIIKRLHDWGANFENTGRTNASDNPVTYLKKCGDIKRHGRAKIETTITLLRNYIQEQKKRRTQQIVTSSPTLIAISRRCTEFLQTRVMNDEKERLKEEVFELLYETIPTLNVAELRHLISKNYPLEHFLMALPHSLIKEAKLALTLGDRYRAQNNSADAFYFYSIAIALAEKTDDFRLKKETHGKASNYLFEIFLGSKEFDDIVFARLHRVIEGDNTDEIKKQFDSLLMLQHFFSDKEKQGSFFAKINAYVHGGNFNPLKITQLYDSYADVVPINNGAITLTSFATKRSLIALQEYRQRLNTLFSSNNTSELQQSFLNAFYVFFEKLLQNSFAIIGNPECHYEVRLLGSYGKGEITPFSSFDFIFIFENAEQQEYFENLWEILLMQFICLGESVDHAVNQNALSFPLSEHGILPGLRIQKALNNRVSRVGTVDTYVGLARNSAYSIDMLRICYQSSRFQQQNHRLFDQFANAILPRNQDGSRHHRLSQELEKNIQNRTFLL